MRIYFGDFAKIQESVVSRALLCPHVVAPLFCSSVSPLKTSKALPDTDH